MYGVEDIRGLKNKSFKKGGICNWEGFDVWLESGLFRIFDVEWF